MVTFHNRRWLTVIALMLVSVLALNACGSDSAGEAADDAVTDDAVTDDAATDDAATDDTADDTVTEEPDAADPVDDPALAAFCEANDTFIAGNFTQGSPEHIAGLEELLLSATDEVRPSLTAFTEFVKAGGIDPANPAPAADWPEDVRVSSEELFRYAVTNCS